MQGLQIVQEICTITEPEGVRERWRLYIEALYDKEGKAKKEDLQVEAEEGVEEDERGPQY